MGKFIIFLVVLFTFTLSAQTKLIAYKSHSGDMTNFSLKNDGNLGITIPHVIYYDESNESDREEIESLNDSRRFVIIKANEGVVFRKKSDFDKYVKLRASKGKLGLMVLILDENEYEDYQMIGGDGLTDEIMKKSRFVKYYIKSYEGFIFDTKSEYIAYKSLREQRQRLQISILELDEDRHSSTINTLTDSKMTEPGLVYFIKTREGFVFDLVSTFENYKKLREIKKENKNIDFIMVSKNDSMLNVVNDSVLVVQQDENNLTPFVYNKSNPTDKTPFLIFIISLTMLIMAFLLWKIEIKQINSKGI